MSMGPEYENLFSVFDSSSQKYLLADSGLIFKAVDPGTAQAVIDKLKADGADVSNLHVVEYPDGGRF